MSTILCFSVNMGCCVYINEKKTKQMILANGCNITKSEKNVRGSEYFPYPLYVCMDWTLKPEPIGHLLQGTF